MRRNDREIKDPAEIRQILKQGKFATIALCRENEPYLVTLNYGFDSEGNALYFHCAPKGLKLDFLARNPQVCATVIEDHGYVQTECDHHYRSVVLWGVLSLVEDLTEKRHAVEVMQNHLETEPATVRAKSPVTDASFAQVAILRLTIEESAGKQNL
jgi:nitroimidazol reductase NimA-like FMN-containing flavoprotein (pyridoxamine 5'-phosphate oxidase superfamily)